MSRLTIEQAIKYWKIFLDEIKELRATPGIDSEEWDEQEKATVAALEALVKQRHYEDLEEQGRLINADRQVDEGFLYEWYIRSVVDTDEPVWTEAHLKELVGDFILIPRTESNPVELKGE